VPDVFLSYSREDQVVARLFAEGLEREGFSVWWDQTLRSGEAYDRVTEAALREARAVVVLWSKHSVESRWVRAEATTADRIGTLAPVMIEDCNRPIMFELTHTAELSHWRGDVRDPGWRAYVDDVGRFVKRTVPGAPGGDESIAARTVSARLPPPATRGLSGKWIALISVVSILALASAFMLPRLLRTPPDAATAAGAVSVAVMPFANVTGNPDKEYIGDGIAEELINALTKVPGLTVPSRTSSFAYKGRSVDLKKVAADLRVDSVLQGSVRMIGDRVRVSAQLIDAKADRNVWSQTYERTATDLFALQDELARKIVDEFRRTRNSGLPELQPAKAPTSDADAYALYLQGNAATQRNSANSLRDAMSAYSEALRRDPNFAEAYLGMATAQQIYGSPLSEVESNARRAAELKPEIADTVARLLAGVAARHGKWVEAEESFRKLASSSNVAVFQTLLADHAVSVLWATGQLRKTIAAYEEVLDVTPGAAGMTLSAGRAYSAIGRDEEARRRGNQAIEAGVDPQGRQALQLYAELAARAGRYADAGERMTAALSAGARAAGAEAVVHKVYAAMGDRSLAPAALRAIADLMPKLAPQDWVVKVWAMTWCTQLGGLDDAFRIAGQLRQQFGDQAPTNSWSWLWSVEMRPFRLDPRFHDFTASLGMIEYWKRFGPPDDCDLAGGKLVCR